MAPLFSMPALHLEPPLYVAALLQNFAKARDACGTEKQITRVEIKQAHAILTTILDKASHIQESLGRFEMTEFMDRFTNQYAVLDARSNKNFNGLKWLEASPAATKKDFKKILKACKVTLLTDSSSVDAKDTADTLFQACTPIW